jgi:hypothetical protein
MYVKRRVSFEKQQPIVTRRVSLEYQQIIYVSNTTGVFREAADYIREYHDGCLLRSSSL